MRRPHIIGLMRTLVALFLALLTIGCSDTPPATPYTRPSPIHGTTTSQLGRASTTEADLSNSLVGEWFLPDGGGSVVIESGPQVTFVDLDGTIVAGPYEATASADSISLTLSSEAIVEVFGEDLGVENIDLAFRPGATEDEVLVVMQTGQGEEASYTLSDVAPEDIVADDTADDTADETTDETTEPPQSDLATLDAELEQVVARLVEGLLACRSALGFVPMAQHLVPGGAVEPYIPGGWPTNPFTGEPVRNLAFNDPGTRHPGDIIYIYFGGETSIGYWTSDGVQRKMHVDW